MTAVLFLSPPELAELTGYVQPAAQIRWLQRYGITHYVRADGRPIVTASALEAHIERRTPPGPDLDAVRVPH